MIGFKVHSWYGNGRRTCRYCYGLPGIWRTELTLQASVMEMQIVNSLCPYIINLRVINRVIWLGPFKILSMLKNYLSFKCTYTNSISISLLQIEKCLLWLVIRWSLFTCGFFWSQILHYNRNILKVRRVFGKEVMSKRLNKVILILLSVQVSCVSLFKADCLYNKRKRHGLHSIVIIFLQ